jgi:hypothetical protein
VAFVISQPDDAVDINEILFHPTGQEYRAKECKACPT